jgi:hypothetical protein
MRFDFHEDDGLVSPIDRDQIDLATTIRFTLGDNRQTLAAQKSRGSLLSSFSDGSLDVDRAVPPIDVATADPLPKFDQACPPHFRGVARPSAT